MVLHRQPPVEAALQTSEKFTMEKSNRTVTMGSLGNPSWAVLMWHQKAGWSWTLHLFLNNMRKSFNYSPKREQTFVYALNLSQVWEEIFQERRFKEFSPTLKELRHVSDAKNIIIIMLCRNQTARATIARGSALEMEIRRGKFRRSIFLDTLQVGYMVTRIHTDVCCFQVALDPCLV